MALHTLALLVLLVKNIQASLPGTAIPPPQSKSSRPSIFPRHVPRSLFLNGTVQLSRFLHLVLVRTDLELCPERVVPWPLSSRQACQDLQVFPVNVSVPGWMGRGQKRRRAGREDGKQAVGFWDHFALTHIPPFCSECLNMKTTQLLLTPAPPPKHSSND